MKKVLYIAVTKDKYELPIAVADSPQELAKLCGTTKNVINSMISHEKAGRIKSKYKKIEIEERNENNE